MAELTLAQLVERCYASNTELKPHVKSTWRSPEPCEFGWHIEEATCNDGSVWEWIPEDHIWELKR